MDNLEFLDSLPGENAETQPEEAVEQETAEQPEQEPTEDKPDRPRGPDGKFLKKEDREPVMVPLHALHETRDEVKALKAQLAALSQPQQQPQEQPVPDMFEDPQAWQAHLQSQFTNVTINERLNLSEELVRQSSGDEIVNEATEWGRQMLANPAFSQAFYSQRNPYGFLVKEYQRSQTMAAVGDVDAKEIEEFRAWKAQKVAQPKPPIPDTLADAQSARGAAPAGSNPPSLDDILRMKVTP